MSELEYAEQNYDRRRNRAMVHLMAYLNRVQPRCMRYAHHGRASRLVSINGELTAVCTQCAEYVHTDNSIRRSKEFAATMRRGRR